MPMQLSDDGWIDDVEQLSQRLRLVRVECMKRCRQLVLRRKLGVTNGGVDFEVGRETRDGLVAEHARSAEDQDAVAHGTRTASPVCADRSAASVAAIVSSGSGPSCAAPSVHRRSAANCAS